MTGWRGTGRAHGEATGRDGAARLPGDAVDKRACLVLFLLALFCYSYFVQPAGWNQISRIALIVSVVDRHQLNIDPYARATGDKALYGGHYYSDKAIGTALLGVPVYAAYRGLGGAEAPPPTHKGLRFPLYAVTVATVALSSAVLSVLLYLLARLLSGSRPWALLLSLLYCFGTMAFPFSTMLFGHQVAAAFAFAAFFALVAARLRSSRSSSWLLLAAGLLASLAVLAEYQTVLIAGFLFLYAATFVRPRWLLGLYVLGGVPGAALLLGYNWHTFDDPFRLAYGYVSNPDFAGMHAGFFGLTRPRWSSFVEITLGARGLLTQSAFLWLVPLGVWLMGRTARWRRECALCVAVGLAFLAWNSAYYLPLGGSTPGPRFLVPSLPFLVVPLALLARLPRPYALVSGSFLLLSGLWSTGLYLLACVTGPQAPSWIVDPVSGYWLPRFAREDLSLNLGTLVFGLRGIESLIPLAVVLVAALALLLLLEWRHRDVVLSGRPPSSGSPAGGTAQQEGH